MTAVIAFSLVFKSCDKDPKEENGVKKLPSKITITWTSDAHTRTEWTFKYDDLNRLTDFIRISGGINTAKIEYDANNRLSKITTFSSWGDRSEVSTVQYVGNNQIIITSDWGTEVITLNANGQMTKLVWIDEDYVNDFTYTDGNLMQAYIEEDYIHYSYSTVLNVFRYATNPDWLLFWIDEFGEIFSPPSKNMLAKSAIYYDDDDFQEWAFSQYQTDSDGYVSSCKVVETNGRGYTEELIMTFEYVSAK
ncbi:MAG: hypothetical protein FWG79_05560 [Bacteroidales bacterium]|nr:hypothetical protein [Bacteroidales bacterium]